MDSNPSRGFRGDRPLRARAGSLPARRQRRRVVCAGGGVIACGGGSKPSSSLALAFISPRLICRSCFERLAEEARTFEAVAPRLIHRLGEAHARPNPNLDLLRSGENRRPWHVKRNAVLRAADDERFPQP